MIKTNYIGWVATGLIVAATVVRAFDYSNFLDLIFTFLGCAVWAVDGYRTKNTPLVTVNIFSVLVVFFGLVRYI